MERLLSPNDIELAAAEAGINVMELCRRANIAHTTFYRWKAGKTRPGIDVYERILDALRAAAT
jgi:predicted transcriptional regulator